MVQMQKQGGAWELKRVRTSLEIECVALELLAQRGLDDVTVEQIASAAGISIRSFYRYFRNARDVLTAVPVRESKRACAALMAREGEGLIEALRAVYREGNVETEATDGNAVLEGRAVALWSRIVGQAPDIVLTESRANTVLAAGLEEVIRARFLRESLGADAPGVVATALAAVIWFVYVRWIESGSIGSLAVPLNQAFAVLGDLLGDFKPTGATAST